MNTISRNYFQRMLLCLLLFGGHAVAEDISVVGSLEELERTIAAAEKVLHKRHIDATNIQDQSKELNKAKLTVSNIIDNASQQSAKIDSQMESLGEIKPDEGAEVVKARNELTDAQQHWNQWLAKARVLNLRIDMAIEQAAQIQKQLLTTRYLDKGLSTGSVLFSLSDESDALRAVWLQYLNEHLGMVTFNQQGYLVLTLTSTIFLLLGFWIRYLVPGWSSRRVWHEDIYADLGKALALTFACCAPQILVSGSIAVSYTLVADNQESTLVQSMVTILPGYFFIMTTLKSLLDPKGTIPPLLTLHADIGKQIVRRLHVSLTSLFILYLFVYLPFDQSDIEFHQLITQDLILGLTVIFSLWVLASCGRLPVLQRQKGMVWLTKTALFIILLAEFVGYRVFALAGLRIILVVSLGFAFFRLLDWLLCAFINIFDQGKRRWQQLLRRSFGLRANEHIPGLATYRVISRILLWSVFVFIVVKYVDLTGTLLPSLALYFTDGISIGTLTIQPTRLLAALIVFTLMVTLSGWFKVRLDKRWLPKTSMERGARDALVTMAGYLGAALALIVGLGIAGVTFTNLAIIAGALSVGIGFGLQNIVNNFVSGLILLFERPIKKGDWIVVGNTEGYVKKISIRSTQIETFDRADVIVPNSDLISTQVINWMLYDKSGRIRIPIGVAYGSDVEKVRQILTDIAMDDERVITNTDDRKTRVLFLRFGDSSLDFELRCHIKNIDERMQVLSDINFNIEKAFRENFIEIPFPQRDLHIRSGAIVAPSINTVK